ncbi:MAG: aminoacetone oxidase family FAD-binding enzyme [Rubritepida sp.]|nr:aminoacetone oxidase family FAD-binding enzyme [Rubritepida sp.]
MERFDVVVLGAGAAGLFAAMRAGQRGRRVLLLDHADEAGKKILISGGGRCNFTNLGCAPDRFISADPRFARAALARYRPADFVALVQKHSIAFHEKTLGQLFCDGSARQIVAMLLAECEAAGVEIRLGDRIGDVAAGFRIGTARGDVGCSSLILATGGLAIPKMGATGLSHRIARQFGLALVETRPGLVPLTFGGADLEMMQPLAGVALPVVAVAGGKRFEEALLFTHRGLSGPAVLQASSYWRQGEAIAFNLLPGLDAGAALLAMKRERPRLAAHNGLTGLLPARLAAALAERHLPPRTLAEIPDRALHALAETLKHWRLMPMGDEGHAKAEVTLGGIATAGLDPRDCQARTVPGLFAVGEAVDVTGWLGGYNFQWAWASGWVAGEAA